MDRTTRFKNKHVLITGGARGIGFEVARQFALEGAVLSILDFNKETLDEACEALTRTTHSVKSFLVNVSDRQKVTEVVSEADGLQPIDILINNAGIANETPFLKIEE